MDDNKKFQVFQIVQNHWTIPERKARQALARERVVRVASDWLQKRLELENMHTFMELWEIGGYDPDIANHLKRSSMSLWQKGIACGPCPCGTHVMRIWFDADGFAIACSSLHCTHEEFVFTDYF